MNVAVRRRLLTAIAAALPRFFLINDALVQRGTGSPPNRRDAWHVFRRRPTAVVGRRGATWHDLALQPAGDWPQASTELSVRCSGRPMQEGAGSRPILPANVSRLEGAPGCRPTGGCA